MSLNKLQNIFQVFMFFGRIERYDRFPQNYHWSVLSESMRKQNVSCVHSRKYFCLLIWANVRMCLSHSTLNDILFIKLNMKCISLMDLRPIVYKRILRGCKPRKIFDMAKTKAQEYHANMFPESFRRTRKIPMPDDINFEEEMFNFE